MTDVGALVLSLGEPSVDRALASVRSQSLPIEEVVVVEGVTPFHRALNGGAERMRSPFFLQVDADFALDPDCAQTLRDAMAATVGVTVAALRDPIMGAIPGVKLFRRRCFEEVRLRDALAGEVDFLHDLEHKGWHTRYHVARRATWRAHTLGEHSPAYTLEYVFGTYYLLGARYCKRDDTIALQWRFGQLRHSAHPMAPVARIAMAHGMFASELRDAPKPTPTEATAEFLRKVTLASRFASNDGGRPPGTDELVEPSRIGALSPAAVLDFFLELGASLRSPEFESAEQFRSCLEALNDVPQPHSWIAEAGLGHGALADPRPSIGAHAMRALEHLAAPGTPKLFPRPR